MTENPWKSVSLTDYENHMKLGSVMQLQTLNTMMRQQLSAFPVSSVMILGIAGGNGLEHLDPAKYSAVCAVDVNADYLRTVQERYQHLGGALQCLCLDLTADARRLPRAELLIANLLIEYIGYPCFQETVRTVQPDYVSCGIQINTGSAFVSDSPYLHAFDGLASVHHQITLPALTACMTETGYRLTADTEYPLPNGKKLIKADFAR